MQAAEALGEGSADGNRVVVRDLYALYPDHVIDADTERAFVADARLIVWQHPVYWYSMPSLMKLWLDEVLTLGWAYGPGGTALHGKDVWLVASTGGSAEAYSPTGYNRYFFDAFLPPYEQTAALCGMRFLPPMLMHGAHAASEQALDVQVQIYRERLSAYPQWPEMDELGDCPTCVVPAIDRPKNEA